MKRTMLVLVGMLGCVFALNAPDGSFAEFVLAPGSMPGVVTIAGDGRPWFTEEGRDRLGTGGSDGKVAEVFVGAGARPSPRD